MKNVGYYNGEIGPLEEMKIPMLDRAVYFGDGCYEATTFSSNHIFALKEHYARFCRSCRLLNIPVPLDEESLHRELMRIVDACDTDYGFLYWQCSRGTALRAHNYTKLKLTPNLMAYAVPTKMAPLGSRKYKMISMEDRRFYMCDVKTLNLLPSVLAFDACMEAGCQETVLYREALGQKRITECAHSNVLMLRDGALVVPVRDNLILPGISMIHLMKLAEENGIPVKETIFTLEELYEADEVMVSSSGALVTAVEEIDGRPVGGKDPENLKILLEAYDAYYRQETS